MGYTLSATLERPFEAAVDDVRRALGEIAADARQRLTAAPTQLTQED